MKFFVHLTNFFVYLFRFLKESEENEHYSKTISLLTGKMIKIRVMKNFDNACFYGISPFGIIVISEEMTKRLYEDEVIAILLHEVGHKSVLQGLFGIFWRLIYFGTPILNVMTKKNKKINFIIMGIIIFIDTYLIAYLARVFENKSDDYAASKGFGRHLASALIGLEKLYGVGVLNRYHDDLFSYHPNTYKRLQRLGCNPDEFDNKNYWEVS